MFWWPVPRAEILIVGALDVGSKWLASQGEAGNRGALLILWHCAGSRVYNESLSQPFLPI